MKTQQLLFCASAPLLMSACTTTTTNMAAEDFTLPSELSKVVIMQPSTDMALITATGVREVRADWTEAASANLSKASKDAMEFRGIEVQQLDDRSGIDKQTLLLAETVMGSALAFGPPMRGSAESAILPTKRDSFDYTLGSAVAPLKELTGADYALFTYSQGDYASAANQILQVAIPALFGAISVPNSGQKTTFISLVDLNDGDLVWMDIKQGGDVRNPLQALGIMNELIQRMPANVEAEEDITEIEPQ